MIFYIHGFGSSSNTDKVPKIKQHFKSLNINVIALDYDSGKIDTAYDTLQNQVDKHLSNITVDEPIMFIGTSLGGYFSLCLRNTYLDKGYVTKAVLLNPVYQPELTLLKYIDTKNKNYDTGNFYTITKEQIQTLILKTKNIFKVTDCLVFLQTGDNVIDSNKSLRFFGKRCIVQSGGSHRFDNIETIFNTVLKYYNNLISGH
jgi:predicted esterase YcpF (UPF0227 family)